MSLRIPSRNEISQRVFQVGHQIAQYVLFFLFSRWSCRYLLCRWSNRCRGGSLNRRRNLNRLLLLQFKQRLIFKHRFFTGFGDCRRRSRLCLLQSGRSSLCSGLRFSRGFCRRRSLGGSLFSSSSLSRSFFSSSRFRSSFLGRGLLSGGLCC